MIRILTAGESHGESLIGVVEGLPAGLPVTADQINTQLKRRWLGYGRGGRSKIEQDVVHIYSGVRFSETIGSPVALRIDNAAYRKDRSGWPEVMAVAGERTADPVTLPRPGHADLPGVQKYDFNDIRPVIERASARETAMRVACCTLGRILLQQIGIEVGSHVFRIGEVGIDPSVDRSEVEVLAREGAGEVSKKADASPTRMLGNDLTKECIAHIEGAKKDGDSLGGAYEIVVTGVPPGLGSYVHYDRRLDALLAQAIVSIPGQKAVEIGNGFAAASTPGSSFHDPVTEVDGQFMRTRNNAGGIEGGVTNGMPVVVRGYMKPIPTLIKPLQTVDIATMEEQPTRYERSDVTSVPAASVVAEAMVCMVIANAVLERYGGDTMAQLTRRFFNEGAPVPPER